MNQLIRAELLKLRTTRTAFWTMVGLPPAVALAVSSSIASAGRSGGGFSLGTVEGVRNVLGASSSGAVVALILGILAMSGEYRHQTVTQTFLVTPLRHRVVAAKFAAFALVGMALAVAATALTLAVALPWLAGEGAHVRIVQDMGLVFLGATAGTALYGAMGVAVGALIRNQAAALVIALAWMMLIENVFVGLLPALGRWLPGGAASALMSASVRAGHLLPMWAAALVLGAYAVGFAVAGSRVVVERDVV
jgi:ABC-2 type transport system permease protein